MAWYEQSLGLLRSEFAYFESDNEVIGGDYKLKG